MGSPTADPFFDAKVKVLGEYVRHHVEEEEKSAESIFAKAIEGGVDTAALGRRLMARREELMEQFDEELLLPQPKALHVTLAQEEEVWSEPPRRDEAQRGWGREEQGRGRQESRESRGSEGREERAYDERRSARGGWEEREGESRQSSGREEERRPQEGARGGREQRGWMGDPTRHSEASRRGWEHRR